MFLIPNCQIASIFNQSLERIPRRRTEQMDINKLNANHIFQLIQEHKLSQKSVKTIFTYLKLLLLKLDGEEYIYWSKYLAKLISNGYGSLVSNDRNLQERLIEMSNSFFDSFMKEYSSKNLGYTVFQVSILAHIIKSHPEIILSYNRKFTENIFKLSQFTALNKESQPKLNLIISTLYLSFTRSQELLNQQDLMETLKQKILCHLERTNKEKNLEQFRILYQALQNLMKYKYGPNFIIQQEILQKFIEQVPSNQTISRSNSQIQQFK